MKILITNDDGYKAKGINKLYDSLSKIATVYMIAPSTEKSACSNAFNMSTPLEVEIIDKNRFAVNSYPADCVSAGLHSNIIPDVDLIISGINHGPNIGYDAFFSGTVGAARTAHIFGKPSIAISYDSHISTKYINEAADFVAKFITKNIDDIIKNNRYYNINYPHLPKDKVKGEKISRTCQRKYIDNYIVKHKDELHFSMQLQGDINSIPGKDMDSEDLSNGFITITPMSLESTDLNLFEKLKSK